MSAAGEFAAAGIRAAVRADMMRRAAVVERACEAALQGGLHGVMVDGDDAWPDPRVPYGIIWDVTLCGRDHPNLGTAP